MTIISGISFAGQTNAQAERLKETQMTMDNLVRQISTGRKFDTMAGFGSDTQFVLQLHADKDQLTAYNANITSTLSRFSIMDKALGETSDSLQKMLATLRTQPGNGNYDMTLITSQAQQLLDYVVDLSNTSIAGRYIFAGTDTQNAPVADKTALATNTQAEITKWMAGTTTTPQFMANVDGFTGTTLGLSPTVSSATEATVRIDTSVNLSYGAIADRSGVQDTLRALSVLANLRAPIPPADVPTDDDLDTVVAHAVDMVTAALDEIQATQTGLGSKLNLLQSIKDTHSQTINAYTTMLDDKENVDPSEVITKLQAIQTRLNASYEVTRMISQLSLTNFLN